MSHKTKSCHIYNKAWPATKPKYVPKEEASQCTQDEIGDNVADGNAIVQLCSWNDIPTGLTTSPGLVQKHFDVGCFDQMTNKDPENSNQINGLVLLEKGTTK